MSILNKGTFNKNFQKFNIISLNLMKDFREQVNIHDFIGKKDIQPKNIGYLNDMMTLLNKKNKKSYFIKVINKKDIIDDMYVNILNYNYNSKNINSSIDEYLVNLQTHFEDKKRIFLVFDAIKRYIPLETLLKKHAKNITEEHILIIFRQILEAVEFLHTNKIFGSCLFLSSFIYDKITQTVKFTDPGFSKIIKSPKDYNIYDVSGFKFNEYSPPEIIQQMDNIIEQEKLKNSNYDIWQLGILFFKIALLGESPFNINKEQNIQQQSEELKQSILNKNINLSLLEKYNPQIIQIIDKMLKVKPTERYSVKQLLSSIQDKDNKIPKLIIQSPKNEDLGEISLNMVNEEKEKIGNEVKIDKDISSEEEDSNMDDALNILKGIKIGGNYIFSKNNLINQEIYPEGSVLPTFKNKYLNKLSHVDQDLIVDLAFKLTMLDKEYQKLEENKLAVYNITNYVNNNLKELNEIDNNNINSLIQKFNSLPLSKIETNDLYADMLKEKDEFSQDKFKALISNLIYEIKRLEIELEQEKLSSEKLRKKIKELEKKISDLNNEHQDKVEYYHNKIEVLEEVIFSTEKKSEKDNNKNELIYTALSNSIKGFTDVNVKLKSYLEENLSRFQENKKDWLEDMIKSKEDFRNEMSYYLQKSIEQPKVYNFTKKDNKDAKDEKSKNEEIEKLKKQITELKELIKEQNNAILNNTNFVREANIKFKEKDEEIQNLTNKLNELKKKENKESKENKDNKESKENKEIKDK